MVFFTAIFAIFVTMTIVSCSRFVCRGDLSELLCLRFNLIKGFIMMRARKRRAGEVFIGEKIRLEYLLCLCGEVIIF